MIFKKFFKKIKMEVEANNKLIVLSNETKKLVSELISIATKKKKEMKNDSLTMVPIDSIRYKKIKNFLIQKLNNGIKKEIKEMQEMEGCSCDCNILFEYELAFELVSNGSDDVVELNFKDDWEDGYDTSTQPFYTPKHGCLFDKNKKEIEIGQIKFMPIEQVTEIYDKYADENGLICLRSFDYSNKDFDLISFSFILKR